jgi:hypothetical protein
VRLRRALARARLGILTVAVVYALSVTAGAVMVHSGNGFALRYRDNLVGTAQSESPILRRYQRGNFLAAAGLDALGNAASGLLSVPAGYCPPAGYGLAAFRGWIGGVVSVDDAHRSRLSKPYGSFYYLVTLILQLIPYSLAGGAGVALGFAAFSRRAAAQYDGARMPVLRIPYEAIRDAGWIVLASLPLFALASLFEFTM